MLSESFGRTHCIAYLQPPCVVIYKRLVDRERGDEENEVFLCNTLYKSLWVMLIKSATLGMMNGDNSAVF